MDDIQDEIQLGRLHWGEIKQVQSRGLKGHLDRFGKKPFLILYYLKTYPTIAVLGFLFGLNSDGYDPAGAPAHPATEPVRP